MLSVFISWSGERSRIVATALSKLLPDVLQDIDTWMSAHDLHAGAQWNAQLSAKLDKSKFGVICLTPENLFQPWLLYEAGCIAKGVSESRVVPYRFGLTAADVPYPLAQFQGVEADEPGTKKLVLSINSVRDKPMPEERLDRVFSRWWPDLQSRLSEIPKELTETPKETLIAKRPANVFWLAHDLARAIRFAMFDQKNRDELRKNLMWGLSHLGELGLSAPTARSFLLRALATVTIEADLSAESQQQLVEEIARAKNDLGTMIGKL
jgi:hypothetical protein